MITIVSLVLFIVLIVRWWLRDGLFFSDLVEKYLFLVPFLPLVSLFNHNLDNDRFEPLVRVLPFYFMTGILLVSLILRRSTHFVISFTTTSVSLLIYVLLTCVQIPLCQDPAWAVTHWMWAIPAFPLFYLGGCLTTEHSLMRSKGIYWGMIGFLCINQLLVAYGLLTGKASDIFFTRNFGSVYASNAVLTFLSTYAGLAWLQASNSLHAMLLMLGLMFLSVALTMSKTAAFIGVMFVVFLLSLRRGQSMRILATCGVALLFVATAVLVLEQVTSLDVTGDLALHWGGRFLVGGFNGSYEGMGAVFENAMSARHDEFAEDWNHASKSNIVLGEGFGHYHLVSPSGYSNGHNLFLMEWFENGLFTTAFLMFFLGSGTIASVLLFFRSPRRLWPLAICIPTFLMIAHTTGAEMSARNSPASYFTAVEGWMVCYLTGIVTYAIPSGSFFRSPSVPSSNSPRRPAGNELPVRKAVA